VIGETATTAQLGGALHSALQLPRVSTPGIVVSFRVRIDATPRGRTAPVEVALSMACDTFQGATAKTRIGRSALGAEYLDRSQVELNVAPLRSGALLCLGRGMRSTTSKQTGDLRVW
jgi:hypothetical protein